MFPHIHARAGCDVETEFVSRIIAAEGDSARPLGAGEQKRHSCQHPLERTFHRMQLNLHLRVFPEQNVVLEINSSAA